MSTAQSEAKSQVVRKFSTHGINNCVLGPFAGVYFSTERRPQIPKTQQHHENTHQYIREKGNPEENNRPARSQSHYPTLMSPIDLEDGRAKVACS
jgi:hypothetical protein